MGIKINHIHNKFYNKEIPSNTLQEQYYNIQNSIDNIEDKEFNRRNNNIERKVTIETKFVPNFAYDTAKEAIELFNINIQKIDFILVASKYPDYRSPFIASTIQDELQLKNNIFAQDIIGGDDLFIKTILFAEGLLKTNIYKNGLIIFYDELYKIKKFKDRRIKDNYKDICSVLHVKNSKNSGIIGTNFWSENNRARYYLLNKNGQNDEKQFYYMPGNDAKNYISTIKADLTTETLNKFNISKKNIKKFIINTNKEILVNKISTSNNIDYNKIMYLKDQETFLSKFFPYSINQLLNKNEIKNGDLILLSSFGFGLTFGEMILKM